ncbi:hypothetical protein BLNAU_23776 [Blattamonas nauphoetae]|uniref:Uncharacterized protein n=1 Tax=Blattamonas nauphoetae TaxID=2049346 RepID=A0ABQ9WPC0_9EUKA|nr:hypothetical protein BLNAU_23776 [Blattamonas nauphoetae]
MGTYSLPLLQVITEETKESTPRFAQNSLCLIVLVTKRLFIPLDFLEDPKQLALSSLKLCLNGLFLSIDSQKSVKPHIPHFWPSHPSSHSTQHLSHSHGDVVSKNSRPSSLVQYYEMVRFRSLRTQPTNVPDSREECACHDRRRNAVDCVVVCGCITKLKEERNNPNTHSFISVLHCALFVSTLIASSQDKKKDANEPTCDRMERESLLTDAAKMEWDADQPNYDQFGAIDFTLSGHSDISGELPGSTVSTLSLPSSSTKNIRHFDKHRLAGDPKLTRINDVKTSYFDDDISKLTFYAEKYIWNTMFFNEKNEMHFGREDSGMVKSLLDVLGVLVQHTVFEEIKRADIEIETDRRAGVSSLSQIPTLHTLSAEAGVESYIHTKWMTQMILVQIANHPHSHIAFNKTTGMGITPARVLSTVLNITLLASIANNVSLNACRSVCQPRNRQHPTKTAFRRRWTGFDQSTPGSVLPILSITRRSSFASRTRGKEQTTIMITTASPLCVSILQL